MTFLRYLASPWTDPDRKRSAGGDSLLSLDGVRGLAVMIVILSHTGAIGMTGQGSLGVLLFFMLSGFVLTIPFAERPARIFGWPVIGGYFANRALRIIPAFVVVVLYLRTLRPETWGWFFENVSFYSGWTYLWSVAEEVRFYVLFPFIIGALALLPSRRSRLVALALMVLIAWQFRTAHMIDMMMDGPTVEFYFWFFLAGMLACLLYGAMGTRPWWIVLDVPAFLILALIFVSSDDVLDLIWRPMFPRIPVGLSLNGWHQPELWCALFAVLLVIVTAFPDTVASRLMQSWPLRHLGLLSYSLYLFHIPVLIALQKRGFEGPLFLATFAGSYAAALVSYLAVEKPALMLKRKHAVSADHGNVL